MDVKTSGFVLSSLKYGETSLILRIYTLDFGLKTFIVKGAFNKKKSSAIYFPLNELEVNFVQKNAEHQGLIYLKQPQLLSVYQALHFNPVKSTLVMFLAEMLQMALQEEEHNALLYQYIKENLERLDERSENYADFHLWFLMQLTKFLGFYPNEENTYSLYFDLENGVFTDEILGLNILTADETQLWKNLLNVDFRTDDKNRFSQKQRKELLNILVNYYQIHLPNFRKPKSLDVLHEIFS